MPQHSVFSYLLQIPSLLSLLRSLPGALLIIHLSIDHGLRKHLKLTFIALVLVLALVIVLVYLRIKNKEWNTVLALVQEIDD
jgi:lysylphosphatidylglycerol synthetase-like protein (DUF2156 family)